MTWFRDLSIQRKIALLVLTTTVTALLLATTAYILHYSRAQSDAKTRELTTVAKIVGETSTAALAFKDTASGVEILEAISEQQSIVAASIYDENGETFVRYEREGIREEDLLTRSGSEESHHFKGQYLIITQPILLSGRPLGSISIQSDLSELKANLLNFSLLAGAIAVFSCALAILLTLRMQHFLSVPILSLVELVKGMSLETPEFSERAKKVADDEVGTLVDAFNEMLEAINDRNAALNYARERAEVALVQSHQTNVDLQHEISERKRAEEERQLLEDQVRHAQKLESLGVLAGGIAHDFNNLLVGVLGNAELVLLDLPSDSPMTEQVEQIQIAAKRCADLCKQMLAYSGRGKLLVESFELPELVEEMGHLLEASISKTITLNYDFDPNTPPVEGDISQIRQVIMNLITNASDAIGTENGRISLKVSAIDATRDYLRDTLLDEELKEGRYAILEVSDTGCGMDEETQHMIFDPFFTTKFAGRGLGLAAVIGIIRSHHGALKLYSEVGHGTTFKVLLPGTENSAQVLDSTKPSFEKEWRSHGTILVADDESTVRTVVRIMLERHGFSILEACDGAEAVELYAQHRNEIRAVLLDMMMPNMNGEEAFQELKKMNPEVRILIASGFNEQLLSDSFSGKLSGGFVQKPFQHAELIARIRELLGED